MSNIVSMEKTEQEKFVDMVYDLIEKCIKRYSVKNGHEAGNIARLTEEAEQIKRDLVDFLDKAGE